MSIVQHHIVDGRILDLFAGSGSLGLEALSRGARSVDFVEKSRVCIETIRKNIDLIGVNEYCAIHVRDAMKFVRAYEAQPYDVAFADPPFESNFAGDLIDMFRSKPFATILGVEHRAAITLAGDRTTTYGDIALTFCHAP